MKEFIRRLWKILNGSRPRRKDIEAMTDNQLIMYALVGLVGDPRVRGELKRRCLPSPIQQ